MLIPAYFEGLVLEVRLLRSLYQVLISIVILVVAFDEWPHLDSRSPRPAIPTFVHSCEVVAAYFLDFVSMKQDC